MNADRWERVQSIFAEAADLPTESMHRVLDDRCAGDEPLRRSVLDLLAEDRQQHTLLDGDPEGGFAAAADAALQSDHLRSLVQQQIGPYRLLRALGEGGMGIVYLAERTDIGGLVAIKLLRDAWLSPMRRRRFATEQQTLVKLNHPAIARLYDASTMQDGTPWFVMEFVDGQPLTAFLRHRAGGLRDDLELFRRVCEAVAYAHGRAIIHRDLKPSNILVTAEGAVKLLDFGISKDLHQETSEGERTVAGLRLLTPGYAAPEQHSSGEVGLFTDVYALGVLLHESLTGQLPQPANERGQGALERPSSVVRRCGVLPGHAPLSKREWADLDVLCLTALAIEPERRYRSADALIRDVSAYLDGRPLEAGPASLLYRARKFTQRNRMSLLSSAAGLLVLIGAVVLFTVRLAHARDTAEAEAARAQSIQHFMQDMLGDGDAEAGPAAALKVTTLLDRAAQQSGALNADGRTRVELGQTIGTMYSRLGEYGKAEQMLTAALAQARGAEGAYGKDVAPLLVQLATVHGDHGEVKEAEAEVAQAISVATVGNPRPDDPTLVNARVAQGRIAVQSGDYPKAAELLRAIAQRDPSRGGVAPYDLRDSNAFLSVAELNLHEYGRAEAASRRAIDLDTRLLGRAHPETGTDLMNLGAIKGTLGDFPEAERLYRQGVGIMQAWYGAEHPDVVMAKGLLARVLVSEHKTAEADSVLQQVLAAQQTIYPAVHERIAYTLNTLGELAMQQGRLTEAEGYLGRSTAMFESLYGANNAHTAATRSSLGAVYLKEGRNELAEATLRAAVSALETLPPGGNYLGLTRGRWGRALLALHRYPEAGHELLAADALLQQMPHPPREMRDVRMALVSLYAQMHQPEKAKVYSAELARLP